MGVLFEMFDNTMLNIPLKERINMFKGQAYLTTEEKQVKSNWSNVQFRPFLSSSVPHRQQF